MSADGPNAWSAVQPRPGSWSPRARLLLAIGAVLGGLSACLGFALIVEPNRVLTAFDLFRPVAGVALAAVGALLGVQSLWLLVASAPDKPYRPGDPRLARTAFVGVWLLGSFAGAGIALTTPASLPPGLALGTAIGFAVAAAGAVWVYRWMAARSDAHWPVASNAIRTRPVAWSVFFAFMWGVVSTLLAVRLEVLALELAWPYVQAQLASARTLEAIAQTLLNDPALVVGLIAGITVVAPTIEEACKAAGLWLFRNAIRSHTDGLLLGWAAGLGFGFIESAGYVLAGAGSLLIFGLIWLRVATMTMHSLTTGLIGAGYARARLTGDRRALRGSLGRAVAVHGLWNAGVALVVASGQIEPGVLPLVVLIAWIAVAARVLPRIMAAAIDRAIQDDHAASSAPLPGEWSPLDDGVWWRFAGSRPEYPRRLSLAPDSPDQ